MAVFDPWNILDRRLLHSNGGVEASKVYRSDEGLDEVVWDKEELRKKAFYYFDLWWERVKQQNAASSLAKDYQKQMAGLDVDEMRRVFAAGFIEKYREQRVGKYKFSSTGVTIMRMEHKKHTHVYELELTDFDNLEKPVRFELVVDDEGGAELREMVDDD